MELTPFEEHMMMLQNYALEINEMRKTRAYIDIEKYITLLENYIDLNRKMFESHNRMREVGSMLDKAKGLRKG